jgi:hypothetical protein
MEERQSIVQTVEVTHGGDTYSANYFVERDVIHARIDGRILRSPVGKNRPSETVKALLTGHLLQRSRKMSQARRWQAAK